MRACKVSLFTWRGYISRALWCAYYSWSIISYVQSRLANAPIDRAADTCSAENQWRSIDGSNIGRSHRWTAANRECSNSSSVDATASTRSCRHRIPLEESRENSVAREFESSFFSSLPSSGFLDAEFLPSFSTGIPGTRGSMARSRASLLAQSFIGIRKFDPAPFFLATFRSSTNSWLKATQPLNYWTRRTL